MTEVTYAPIDVPKPVGENVWVVDSGPMRPLGVPIPIRMTVIRLDDGSLLLHSPTPFGFPLKAELDRLGPIRHLVSPNTVHWSFVKSWQAHYREATVWAAPGLRKRPAVQKSGLRIDEEIPDGRVQRWGETVDVVLVRGAPVVEAALFHHPSRTLVLTDLIVNVEPHKLPPVAALGARLVGSAAPHGRAPVYARAAFKGGGAAARQAAQRLVAFEPERVIFSHGAWFETDGTARLRRALDWLLG